jgi:hypothetical protein
MRPHLQEIDNPDNEYYDLANGYMERFDVAASEATEEHKNKPESLRRQKLSLFIVCEIYKRLKIPMFGMVNQRRCCLQVLVVTIFY